MQESKHKFISARIMRAVAERQWKDKLPPVRTLAAMFSVSSRTVQKALQTVYASGMVIPNGARGNLICYKTEVPKQITKVTPISLCESEK